MNWEQWFCLNEWCNSDAWLVQRPQDHREVWLIAQNDQERPWTLAASLPVCPRCGTTLSACVELEGDDAQETILEPGKMLDFVQHVV